jgi:TrmH family RNA methyltransferase
VHVEYRRHVSLQITGADEVLKALENGTEIKLVLVDREEDCTDIINLCEKRNIPVTEGSSTDLWRMSADGQQKALALIGREPKGTLEEVFKREGVIWLFDGVEYAPNLGFGVRTAEVSGATAVIINVKKTHDERRTIRRAGMRATRFIPVIYASTEEVLAACNRKIVVAEDVGEKAPWNADLTGDVLLVVGAENAGVSKEVLDAADEIVRLPMPGFVPSYNLQVAVSALAIERLRQSE